MTIWAGPQELLVHVGHGKTGSSYLQSALAASRDTLAAARIAYPIAEDRARIAQVGGISSGNLRYAPGMLADLLQSVPENAQQVLISSESLFTTLIRGGEAFRAEAAAALPGARLRILLYIRDPLDHAVSNYHQDVKRGGFTGSFSESLASYNFPSKVIQFLRQFTEAGVEVVVRNYSRHSKALLPSFEAWLGVTAGTLTLPPVEQVNRSLTLAEIELQKAFNRHLGPDARRFVSDPLCMQLPDIRAETPPLAEADLAAFLERMEKIMAGPLLEQLIPPAERYVIGRMSDHAERFLGRTDPETLSFTPAQLAVVVNAVHAELARVTVLRKQLKRQRKPK